MKHLVPTLAVLAIAAVPAMGAEDFSVKVKGVIQTRAQLLNDAQSSTGADYDPVRKSLGSAESVRFGLRRSRIGVDAKTSEGWYGNITLRAGEGAGLDGLSGSASNTLLYYSYVGRTFKTGEIEHDLKIGLDKSFNNESSISTSTLMMPSDRVTAFISDDSARNIGVAYRISHEYIRAGLDVANNNSAQTTPSGVGIGTQGDNGIRTSARVEGGLLPARKMESFAGAPGTHVVVGFEIAKESDRITGGTVTSLTSQDRTVSGLDLLVHVDGLSFLADYKLRKIEPTGLNGNTGVETKGANLDRDQKFFALVAGYAIPTESGVVIEPAVRFQRADVDGADETAAGVKNSSDLTTNGEFNGAASGSEIGFGVNLYWNGHKNKTQFAYTTAKADDGDATAKFFTVQQQITF